MQKVVAVLVFFGALVLPAPAAFADPCPAAGGAALQPAAAPPGDFQLLGGGWGHGAGMSQYGAQGAGLLGCDADTILRTYYPGVAVETVPVPQRIRVNVDTDATTTKVTGVAGTIGWELCLEGRCSDLPVRLEPGQTWDVSVLADGVYRIRWDGTEIWRGGDRYTLLRARLSQSDGDNRIIRVGNRYKWGLLEFDSVAGGTPRMFVNLDIAPFDRYLYGLSEVPSSWPMETLKAQVIAARSYAVTRRDRHQGGREACRCDVYATMADQAYTGYEKESEGSQGQYGARWRSAVDATRAADFSAARLLRHQGKTADAYYSSSHGGLSESSRFVFGSEIAYLQPVDDSRWEAASSNPYGTWAQTFSAAELGRALGVGIAQSVTLPDPRGVGCRVGEPSRGYGGVVVRGTTGERRLGGNEFRRVLGLRSTLFTVNADRTPCAMPAPTSAPPPPPPPPEPPPPPSPPWVDPPGTPVPPVQPPPKPVVRVAGSDRLGTALEVSRRHWSEADEVLVATARSFPDALAASALAKRLDAPLVLTEPEGLSPAVLDHLRRLLPDRVTILGGTRAVSQGVEDQLRAAGFAVRRLAGVDRFATAAAVATAAGPSARGEVALALGADFADALAAGALAATPDALPVLLTERDRVPDATIGALDALGTRKVLVIGGEGAVSAGVAERLRELGYEVERLGGRDRFATSAATTRAALSRFGQGERPVVLASGMDFPDAMAAGPLAGRLGAVLQLVPAQDLNEAPDVLAVLGEYAAVLSQGVLVGGSGAVSDRVAEQAAQTISE